MIQMAVINSAGLVLNVVALPDDWTDASDQWQPRAELSLVEAGGGQPGDTWDGAQFIRPTPPPAPPKPTDTAQADARMKQDPTTRGLVQFLADKFTMTPAAVRAAVKSGL